MQGVAGLVTSRVGAVAVLLAAAVTAAWADAPSDVPLTPFVLVGAWVLCWPLVAVAARAWSRATWPAAPASARPRPPAAPSRTLREDVNAAFLRDRGGFLFARRTFFTATGLPPVLLDAPTVDDLARIADERPVLVADDGRRRWWSYAGHVYWENAGYSERDVLALLTRRERRNQRELERAHQILESDHFDGPRRDAIPREVRRAVFQRDGGQCTECRSTFDLQYDHVIPVALGGATRAENLQLLCGTCNREKGADL